ncbi:MAG: MarR family transcriptional regulator, partial [Candidatus Bathyarchaeia archaeon]
MDKDRIIKASASNRENPKDFLLLYKLAEMGACRNTIKISTTLLAKETGLSQQSASRRLISLERKGLIQRSATKDGSLIRISRDGEEYLRRIYLGLRAIFEEKPS